MDIPTAQAVPIKFRNFKRAPWNVINEDLMKVNWPLEFIDSTSVDKKVDKLYEVINATLDTHCPEKSIKRKSSPSWFSSETIRALHKKRIFHAKWKKHGNQEDYKIFSFYREEAKINMKKDFECRNRDIEDEIKACPKAF